MILTEYASGLGASKPLTEMRLSITVDERYHLQLKELKDGRILIRTRLQSLPEAGAARDELLKRCGKLICGRVLKAQVACTVDSQERAIWLQQACNAASTQDLDEEVGAFVNELAFWTSALAA